MPELLPAWPLLAAFLAASFLLCVTPGPAVMYVVACSLSQGRRAGLASVAGVALGNLGNAVGASLGLAALFALSAMAFTVVKYAGAAYLVWLGIQALRGGESGQDPVRAPASARRLFRDGFVVALLNPKTAIFFAAFLPQFMGSGAQASPLQSVALGATFVALAGCTDTLYALAAGSIAPALARARGARRLGRWLSGGAFIGLGVFTAVSAQRATH